MVDVFDVAKYYIKSDLIEQPNSFDGNMKLQKLTAFSDFVSLAMNGTRLFDEPIYAFQNGCVIEKVRQRYKNDYEQFYKESIAFNPVFNQNEYEILNIVKDVFGKLSARELSRINHQFNFWKKAYCQSCLTQTFRDKEASEICIDDVKKEIGNLQSVIDNYMENKKCPLAVEYINDVQFYFDPCKIELNDEIINQLDDFSLNAEDNAYTIYIDDDKRLVIY